MNIIEHFKTWEFTAHNLIQYFNVKLHEGFLENLRKSLLQQNTTITIFGKELSPDEYINFLKEAKNNNILLNLFFDSENLRIDIDIWKDEESQLNSFYINLINMDKPLFIFEE